MNETLKAKRSAIMARVRSRDTGPELEVRRLLHRLGYRFRLHRPVLLGRPDVILSGFRTALFVHGCFWHQHDCSRGSRRPRSNQAYWDAKLDRNVARDSRIRVDLERRGWRTLIIWECELRDKTALAGRLRALLPRRRDSAFDDASC